MRVFFFGFFCCFFCSFNSTSSLFVQCCMSSSSNRGLQFTPQLEGSGWPCSSCGFSSLSAASRGRSDPQTSAASCFSTWPMRMCCSRSPRCAPSGCSPHQTPSEEKPESFHLVRFRQSRRCVLVQNQNTLVVWVCACLFTGLVVIQCCPSSQRSKDKDRTLIRVEESNTSCVSGPLFDPWPGY